MSRRDRTRRPAAHLATLGVVVLHATLLILMWNDRASLPPAVTLLELLWAAARRPAFDLLIATLLVGPVLTYLAWTTPGLHRRTLVGSWAVFGATMVLAFGDRLPLMFRVIHHVVTH